MHRVARKRLPVLLLVLASFPACSTKKNDLTLSPQVSSVSPEGGPIASGQVLTISGQDFDARAEVQVGGLACRVASATPERIRCVLPAMTVGWKNVTVKNPPLGSVDFRSRESTLAAPYAAGAVAVNQPSITTSALPGSRSLRGPTFLGSDGTNLIVSDSSNTRLLIWNNAPASLSSPDLAIGKINLSFDRTSSETAEIGPRGVCTDGTRLVVSDLAKHRLLVWNQMPSSFSTEADFVLGQADRTGEEANAGGATSASSLSSPLGLYCDSTRILVADSGNHRVRVWNGAITATNQAANLVIGQADFTSSLANGGGAASLATLNQPYDVSYNGSVLAVSDNTDNRVLIYNGVPAVNGAAADRVLCQATGTATAAATTQARCRNPRGLEVTSTHLAIADTNNSRILIWSMPAATDPIGWADGRNADFVLGQPDFVSRVQNNGGVSANSLYAPGAVRTVAGRFYVSEISNSRVLGWNSVPAASNTAADFVLGQTSLTQNNANNSISAERKLSGMTNLSVALGKLIVASNDGHKIGIYDPIPSSHTEAIDDVLGQADLVSSSLETVANNSDDNLRNPKGTYYDSSSGKFFVVDSANNRVLIYNAPPSLGSLPAVVIGQANYTTITVGTTSSKLDSPQNVCVAGGKLFVSDRNNHRILGFNSIPTVNGQAADFVIGQTAFGLSAANQGSAAPIANSLYQPVGLYCDSDRLIVSDATNNRVLIYSPLPSATNEAASVVLGQATMSDRSKNQGQTTSSSTSLYSPLGVRVINSKLWVADTGNNRLLIWNSVPTVSGTAAHYVWGQADFSSRSSNRGLTSPGLKTLSSPNDIQDLGDGRIGIADTSNNRILLIPSPY